LTDRIPTTFTGFRHSGYYSPNPRYRPESARTTGIRPFWPEFFGQIRPEYGR